MKDISIIVPIYNAEKYLNKCIDSLVNQTKKELEFILINDGSTDSSEDIIKSYKDKRIKYFKNKNQGIGKTRNFGIDKATGKYLMFLDSDDYLDINACEKLYNKALKEKSDLVVFDFYRVEETLKEVTINNFKSSSLKENPNLLLDINLGPCNKLIKRELIDKNNTRFNEELKYEDTPFVTEIIKNANKISKLNEYLHYYVIHSNSETTIRDERVFDIIKIVDIIRKNFKKNKELTEVVNKLTVRILTNYTIQQRVQKDSKIGNRFINEAFSYMEKNIPDYKDNKYYENRSILKRTIEKNKILTKIYCNYYHFKKEKTSKKNIDEIINNVTTSPSFQLSAMILSYFFIVLTVYSVLQILGITKVLPVIQTIAIAVPMIMYICKSNNSKKSKFIISIIYLLLMILLPFIYNHTYDLTEDGNSYHKSSIAFIKNGWNPLYEDVRDFQKTNNNVIPIEKETRLDLWMEHYPKATWISAAAIYSMTGNIESGKCITLLLSIVLVLVIYNILKEVTSKFFSILISILIALNPITLSQIFTYYLDSLMGILFAIELLLLFTINPMKKQNNLIWFMIAATASIFVNLKFTGLLYSGVIAAVFYFYWLFKYLKEKDFWNKFLIITRNFIIVFGIAVFLVGANSYVKNTIDHINPLYPLIGKDKVDIITTMQPAIFSKISRPQKFIWSLFSQTQNILQDSGKEPKLKLPTQLYKSEISELLSPDVRIAGFGPFFALIFIFSTIVFIICLIKLVKNEKESIKYVFLSIATIIISMILVGEYWWARYVPQMYLYVIGTILLATITVKYFKNKIISYVGILLIIGAIGLNTLVFFATNYLHIRYFIEVERDIKTLQKMDNPQVKLVKPELYGFYYNLNDKKIRYTRAIELSEVNKKVMYHNRLEVSANEKIR